MALPALILLGFLALIWFLFGDSLVPARPVEVVNVVSLPADPAEVSEPPTSDAPSPGGGTVIFQASGWIEAAPLPTKATALESGVVESVEVLEGDSVRKGDILARLVARDAELDLATAVGQRDALQAQAKAHQLEIEVVRAEVKAAAQRIEAAQARARELADPARRLAALSESNVSEGEVQQARLRLATQQAEIEALRLSYQAKLSDLERHEALNEEFVGRLAEAGAEVDRRRLALDRMTIRAPMDGVVQRLLAAPGQKKMLEMDDPDSATIAILFDPRHLQARIDVPLDQAARVSTGQAVRLKSELLPNVDFRGRVTSLSGGADIQRNTLEVKVAIENPDPRLKPDMLVRAGFLSGEDGGVLPDDSSSRLKIFAPESALVGTGDGMQPSVWVTAPDRRTIEPRAVAPGNESKNGFRRIISGLKPGDQVVVEPTADLRAGQRVTPLRSKS